MTSLPTHSADRFTTEALCEAFTEAFADYLVGPPRLRSNEWPGFLTRQGIDLSLSRVVAASSRVQAFALIGRQADRARLATMGARPEARGSGAAPGLLDLVIAEARQRGDQRMDLEVFARNARALALYRSRGFEVLGELHGYVRAPQPTLAGLEQRPQPVETAAAAAWLDRLQLDGLPFQVSGPALAAHAREGQALEVWQLGAAQLVFSVQDAAHLNIVSLVDTSFNQDDARVLLRTLVGDYPASTVRVPQLQREEFGGRALEAEGWQRLELHQLLMRAELT